MSNTTTRKRSSAFPFALLFFVLIGIVAYSAYWIWMSGKVKSGAEDWIEQARANGITVEYSDLRVTGAPFRFALEVQDPIIDDPYFRYHWEAETLQVIAQAWNANHFLVRSPGENFTRLPNGEDVIWTLGGKAIASLRFSDGKLKNFGVQFPEPTGRLDNGDLIEVKDLIIAFAPDPSAPETAKFRVTLDSLKLPNAPQGAEWLGRDIENLVVMAEIENFYPVAEGRMTPVEWRVDRNRINLLIGEILMGPLKLAVKSNITLDREMNPDGTVGINLQQGAELKDALREAGLLTPDYERIINMLTAMSQNDAFATVKVENRTVSLLGNELFRY